MRVRQFLDLTKDKQVGNYLPESEQIKSLLISVLIPEDIFESMTGAEIQAVMARLQVEDAREIGEVELNDGVDVNDIVQPTRSSLTKLIISSLMASTVFLSSIGFMYMIVTVSTATNAYPSWEVLLVPVAIPGVVIWQLFGILTEERKDAIKLVTKQALPISRLSTRIK